MMKYAVVYTEICGSECVNCLTLKEFDTITAATEYYEESLNPSCYSGQPDWISYIEILLMENLDKNRRKTILRSAV